MKWLIRKVVRFVVEKDDKGRAQCVVELMPGRQGNVLELPLSLKGFWDELGEGESK